MCTDLGLFCLSTLIIRKIYIFQCTYVPVYLFFPFASLLAHTAGYPLVANDFIDTRRMEQTTMEHLDDSEVWGILLLKCGCGGHRVLSFPSLCVITFLFLQPGAGTIGSHFLLSHYLDNSGITCFHDHGLLPAT